MAPSLDWPGWSRGAKTSELALQTLESYRERYLEVARFAGLSPEFDAAGPLDIVEDKVGTGSVDFYGMSFAPSAVEQDPMGSVLDTKPRPSGHRGVIATTSRLKRSD